MTTTTDTRTLTERAMAASADRVLQCAIATGRPHRRDGDLAVAWQGDRGFFTNVGCVLGRPDSWPDLLDRIGEVVPPGRPVSLVSAESVPDLGPAGWQLVGHPPLMVRAAAGDGPPVPAELTVTRVSDDASLEVFERTLVDGYPDPSLQPYEWGHLFDARVLEGTTTFLTGWVAGRPVATAAGHVAHGVNLVELVATAPDGRGRGYGAALTWAAATVEPGLPAVLIASDLGRPVYERLGFLAVSGWTFWHRPA
jgi:GNAT superfamily N-acetyltransferase